MHALLRLLPLFLLLPGTALASGNAVQFDGATDYVSLGLLNPGATFTFETWVSFDSTSSYHTVLETVDTTNAYNSVYIGYVTDHWQMEVEDNNHWEGDTCTES